MAEEPERPCVEDVQPDLLRVITSFATLGNGAHLRRRAETMRCCRTLNELTTEVKKFRYVISRSGVYLRLLPRISNSREGHRHVKTVQVKLLKARTSEHKNHEDTAFCVATIMAVNSLASFLGFQYSFFSFFIFEFSSSEQDKILIYTF